MLPPLALLGLLGAGREDPLDPIRHDPALEGAVLASVVREVESGALVDAQQPGALLTPASTVKLVTALAILEQLPLDEVLETPVGAAGEVEDGVLRGDLVLVGVGDPSLGAASIDGLAEAVVLRGVTRVEGDVVADGRRFTHVPLGEGWMWDDLPYEFSPPITAIAVDGNVGPVTVRGVAPGEPAEVVAHPCVPVDGFAVTVADDADEDLILERLPGDATTVVRGEIPADHERTWQVTIPDPTACAAMLLGRALAERGVETTGRARVADAEDPRDVDVLAHRRSPPLRELVRHMLVESDNLYAEGLFRLLDPAPVGRSYEGARPAVEALMAAAGVPDDGWRLVDASGLSRYDLLSPETLVRLLRFAWARPYRHELLALLPSSGQGTLEGRLVEGAASGRVFAKTGSMTGVYNLAGYVVRPEGEPLAFALMSNGVVQPSSAPRAAQDLALQRLAVLPPPRGCAGRR